MKTIYISRKKSGNLTMTSYKDSNWELISESVNPKELLQKVKSMGAVMIITAEYSQSQGKKLACNFSEKDALRAFGISTKKSDILANF